MDDLHPIAATTQAGGDLQAAIHNHLRYSIGKTDSAASLSDWRLALSRAIRDLMVGPWFETTRRIYAEQRKRVYYLSMEFLIGRLLEDAVVNLGLEEEARAALEKLGADFDAVVADEPDAALGNGGLGRLAACFLDSMSTVGVAAYGYGIRYEHGLFRQRFRDGWQVEQPEDWLTQIHPWEFPRAESTYPIGFGGEVHDTADGRRAWAPAETVLAVAYDTPIPGWQGTWVNTLRLWSAQPTQVFDLEPFNRGDFIGAAVPAVLAQTISRVLYPDDSTPQGKELRLKQEFFFTAASLRDIVRRFSDRHSNIRELSGKIAVQLNDTHPAIAVPELVRLLVDEYHLDFKEALPLARDCLHYTNHTLMPEALERWPVDLMWRVLPRHMELVERIDEAHAEETASRGQARPNNVKIVEAGDVHMGNLAFIGTRRVNGVSALHTDLMKETVFKDLHGLHPDRIVNQTNGVTPRRWLLGCNPALSQLITDAIGPEWPGDLDLLQGLTLLADDRGFQARFAAAKERNKRNLADFLASQLRFSVDPSAMFDIQIKRIHEYKRQLMNILEAVAAWNEMRRNPEAPFAPRVRIFGGKAAPGYAMAKLIIKLINDVAKKINADMTTRDRLSIVYVPNYNVSMAERLIPAADLSEQISTAGMEASGTGNMKFAMNGALTIGTMDGANVEIHERVGDQNIFIFGLTADQVTGWRESGYEPESVIARSPRLAEVIAQIEEGFFSPDDPDRYRSLVDNLRHHDWFMVAADFDAYYEAQRRADAAWADRDAWIRSAILNTAPMGWFSSDRTIRGYARDVWGVEARI